MTKLTRHQAAMLKRLSRYPETAALSNPSASALIKAGYAAFADPHGIRTAWIHITSEGRTALANEPHSGT